MDDIRSIITQELRIPITHDFKIMNLQKAYKWAKKFVEFRDIKLFDLVKRFYAMRPNIIQYLIYYEQDETIRLLCDSKLIDFGICKHLLHFILRGKYPKTCSYIARKVHINLTNIKPVGYGKNVIVQDNDTRNHISKRNVRVFAKNFEYLNDSNKKCIFEYIIYYGFAKLAKTLMSKYNINLEKIRVMSLCEKNMRFTPIVKSTSLLLLGNDRGDLLGNRVMANCDFKTLRYMMRHIIFNKSYYYRGPYVLNPSSDEFYFYIIPNENRLYIFEELGKKACLNYKEIAKQAIMIDDYVLLNSLIITKKINQQEANQIFSMEINFSPAAVLLLKYGISPKNITNLLRNTCNIKLIKAVFKIPENNSSENRDIVLTKSWIMKKYDMFGAFFDSLKK
jgi:hypothetical protein